MSVSTPTMPLSSIENKNCTFNDKAANSTTPIKQRIISESTGLVKFNIKKKQEENNQLNREFEDLEIKAQKNEELKPIYNGFTLPISPNRASRTSRVPVSNEGVLDEALMLELASKQREVLEYKSQLAHIKQKLVESEKELQEIEKKCNRTTSSIVQKTHNNIHRGKQQQTLRNRPSLSTFRQTLHEQQKRAIAEAQFKNQQKLQQKQGQQEPLSDRLKRKISVPVQLNKKSSILGFDSEFQTNGLWQKGITAFNNFMQNNPVEHIEEENGDSDTDSDYGSADASDYQVAVK